MSLKFRCRKQSVFEHVLPVTVLLLLPTLLVFTAMYCMAMPEGQREMTDFISEILVLVNFVMCC